MSRYTKHTCDFELLKGAASGNGRALEYLYRRYQPALERYAVSIVRRSDVAQDVIQTLFVKVIEDKFQVSSAEQIKPLLYRSVRNACFNELRSLERRKERESGYQLSVDAHTDEGHSVRVQQALKQLSGVNREMVQLKYQEGLTQAEISEVLDIPVGTVKSRMSTALGKLRALLTTENELR